MSIVSDHQEFERLRRLAPMQATTVTEFDVSIRADRAIERDEVTALLSQRFPIFSVTNEEDREVVDRLRGEGPAVPEFYFTFGFGQQLPGGAAADSCYARVEAPDFEAARERMVATFGRRWSFQYTSAEEAGVERGGLKEVAFLPWPGPMLADIPEEVTP